MAVWLQVLFRFLIFIAIDFYFIRLFFRRLHRILIIFKYVFIYLCISILSVFSYVKGSVLVTRVRWFRWQLFVRTFVRFFCYQFVGMCFEFRRTVSLFIVQTFWILWSHFRQVICFEFSFFHDFVAILFMRFYGRVFPPFLSHLSSFSFLFICKMQFHR